MKSSLLISAVLLANFAQAETYTVDAGHSAVEFSVHHMVGNAKGNFKEFEGEFQFNAKKPEMSGGKFIVKTKSVDTNNSKRDEHLRSDDFFGVEKFPEMTFEAKKITPAGKGKYKMAGELTLHGVTKPMTFDLEFNGTQIDPWGNTRAGFNATGKVHRKDFGIVWNKALDHGGMMLGEDVTVMLSVEAIQKKADEKKHD